jgi:hypothetical protein
MFLVRKMGENMAFKSILAAFAALILLGGCGSDSPDVAENELAAHSWATLDDDGVVTQVGFSVDRKLVGSINNSASIPLSLSAEVREQTLFDHIEIDFMKDGHVPGPFMVPHFDFHFYTTSNSELSAVDCVDEPLPEASRIPEPYIIPSTAIDPTGTCVPAMGVHAIDPTSPELAPDVATAFADHFIFGYHNGEMVFIEPMIAQSVLLAGTEISGNVPRPEVFGRTTLYPATWSLTLSEDGTEYEVTYTDFSEIK